MTNHHTHKKDPLAALVLGQKLRELSPEVYLSFAVFQSFKKPRLAALV